MRSIEECKHAGKVPHSEWAKRGIKIPIFDIDGTVTHFNTDNFVEEVMDELAALNLSKLYEAIAFGSNNRNPVRVHNLAKRAEDILQVDIFAICAGEGYRRKPFADMGKIIADHFNVKPENWA